MKARFILLASLCIMLLSTPASHAEDPGWPRQLSKSGSQLIIHQPQVDEWREFRDLDWRMAIELTPKGGKTVIGVVEMHGMTNVDFGSRTVQISQLQLKKSYFPSLAPDKAAKMEKLTLKFLPPNVSIALEKLVACVPKKQQAAGVALKNDPPSIFVSHQPAILLDLYGQPVYAAVRNTTLQYVVNTRWPLLFDTSDKTYYLLAGKQWLQASSLQGQWTAAGQPPAGLSGLPDDERWTEVKKYAATASKIPGEVLPVVFYSTTPAEIILIDGQPTYAQIPGTRLMYVTNTNSYLFLDEPTGQTYYLTAGRWFRAASLQGPWIFATPDLPADFTRIPADSPAAQVLASVPGTDEAKDAALIAQIPIRISVDPSTAAKTATVTYAGAPEFAPIEGTSLYYATNSPQKVIRVGDIFYLCLQGVWFVSANPQGPWQTASSVPPVIYTIPPSSPVYNVTYVTQTIAPDGSVQASYTSGYTGVYLMGVSSTVVVTSGTGYYYPPYISPYPVYGYPAYYPPPYTYGYAAHYQSATGAYGVSQTAYGAYGTATRTASYNPYTGTYARTASASTAYGSAAAGRAYNPYTGASGATVQGSNAYGSWGSSTATKNGETAYSQHQTTSKGTTGSVQTSSGGKAYGSSTQYGSTAVGKTSSGDVYAGHDGNAYKKTSSGWQQYSNGSWNSVQPGTSQQAQKQQQSASGSHQTSGQQAAQRSSTAGQAGGSEQMQRLEQESQSRQRGEQSSQRSQQSSRSGGGWGGEHSFGGGGERGFGGGEGGGRGFGSGGRRR